MLQLTSGFATYWLTLTWKNRPLMLHQYASQLVCFLFPHRLHCNHPFSPASIPMYCNKRSHACKPRRHQRVKRNAPSHFVRTSAGLILQAVQGGRAYTRLGQHYIGDAARPTAALGTADEDRKGKVVLHSSSNVPTVQAFV